jgi:hypothetical protein
MRSVGRAVTETAAFVGGGLTLLDLPVARSA